MGDRRTALITGSTSGIGQAIATAFAGAGHDVVLNGFGDPGAIESLRARLERDHGVTVRHIGADMSRPGEIEAMMRSALAGFGAVDVLVNNAGIQHVAAVDEFPVDKWDAILAVNLSSAFHTTRLALPAMKARGRGRIINIGSIHATIASPFKSAYTAAKHGLAGFTRSVALEVAQAGITVNAICPGYVRTPLVDAQIPDQARTRGISEDEVIRQVILANQPTRRFVGLDGLAAIALFLASDAARSITGAMIAVDGGWTAQ